MTAENPNPTIETGTHAERSEAALKLGVTLDRLSILTTMLAHGRARRDLSESQADELDHWMHKLTDEAIEQTEAYLALTATA